MGEELGGEETPPASLREVTASVAFVFLLHNTKTLSYELTDVKRRELRLIDLGVELLGLDDIGFATGLVAFLLFG